MPAKKKALQKKPELTLNDLLLIKLQSLYDIESELIKALPKMAAKASDQELKAEFREHLDQTRVQAERLEKAFAVLGIKPKKLKVAAIRGLVEDAAWVMKNVHGKEARDANLIAAASYVEHYEMAGYTSAVRWAQELGLSEVEDILSETLREEIDAADKLSALAMLKIDKKVLPLSRSEDLSAGVLSD